jgi:zinc transporter, ZIP family
MDVATVLAAGLLTALATGLGALPLAIRHRPSARWLRAATGIAAAAMLVLGAGLLLEGWKESAGAAIGGALVGGAFVALAERLLARRPEVHFSQLSGVQARKALLLVGVMTVHSFAEGIGVGVSFGAGETFGVAAAAAIALPNVPEGLAISLLLVPRGVSVPRAAGWSVFSSLPQPLMAIPAFLFVSTFEGLLPFGLGFAAGAMVWMVVRELLPDVLRAAENPQ